MMGALRFEITGAAALINELERYEDGVARAGARAINKFGQRVVRSAKKRAPVDTGYLRAQIEQTRTATPQNLETEVTSRAQYSAFVGLGTGRRGRASGVDAPEGWTYGDIAGQAAQPFMIPSTEEHLPGLVKDMRDALEHRP